MFYIFLSVLINEISMTFMKELLSRTGNECCFEIQIDYFI